MRIQLFIDTNAYLKFYHFSNEDLEELNKLLVLLENDQIELHLPEQVINEFKRNRDVKLADALKQLKESKLNNQFPQFCKGYAEFEKLKKLIKDYNSEKQALLKNVMLSIESNSLNADKILQELFEKACVHKTTEEFLARAKRRFDLGNPPGKDKSYGDALNWEVLLNVVEEHEDLYFVADDKDWFSKINNSHFNSYLKDEWKEKKNSKINFYKTLSDFFKDVLPDIKLATELEKDLLIAKLVDSGTFYDSRKILQKLSKFESFSTEQANQYISASISNTQVHWISEDEDINEYLYTFVENNKDKIDEEILNAFYESIPKLEGEAVDYDDLPF